MNLLMLQNQALALTYVTPTDIVYSPAIYAVLLLVTVVFTGVNLDKLE
jgi:hypothetical protein